MKGTWYLEMPGSWYLMENQRMPGTQENTGRGLPEGAAGMNHPLTPSPLSVLPPVQPNQKPEGKEAHGCSQTTDMGQSKGWRVSPEPQMCHDHEKYFAFSHESPQKMHMWNKR